MWADTCPAEAVQGQRALKLCVFVRCSGYLAMPTVTSHTTELVLLSAFTAHCVVFTARSVILWEATIEISSEVKFRGLSYPSEQVWGTVALVCVVKLIPPRNSICFYFRYLTIIRQCTIAVRLRPPSVVHDPLKRYPGIDFSSLSLCFPAGLLLDSVWFSSQDFPKWSDVKDNRHG